MTKGNRKLTVMVAALTLLALVVCFLLFRGAATDKRSELGSAHAGERSASDSPLTNETKMVRRPAAPSPRSLGGRLLDAAERAKAVIDSRDLWRTPIKFFGMVVDENGNPVPDAEAHMRWTDLSKRGHSEKRLQSDANGRFELKDVQGYALSVRVEKPGYYTSISNQSSFFYAGQDANFVPDSNKPILFHLRTRRTGELLVRNEGSLKVPLSGEPIELDLATGKLTKLGRGGLRLEYSASRLGKQNGERFDWKLRLSTPNGAVMESSQEFDFIAPEAGYREGVAIEMLASAGDDWRNMIERKLFVKLANGNYARLSFYFISYNGVLQFTSFLNPNGSRNLEYDDAVQPKQTRFQ